MATDPNVADPVKLAAIKDALDRSGIQAKTAVTVEVSTKPYELVFDRIVSGPRNETPPALAIEADSLDESTDTLAIESVDEIEAEVIDPEDGDPSFGLEYSDAIMSDHPTTPDPDVSSASEPYGPDIGPLGPTGPAGSGLMPLSDAVEAAAAMRDREARVRDMRRR